MKMTRQQKEFYKIFSQHGSGDAKVELPPSNVALLIHIAYLDINEKVAEWFIPEIGELAKMDFYSITPEQIDCLPKLSQETVFELLEKSEATNANNVIFLYLKNLSELYRRRFKFYNILRTQPFPRTDQIGPRCLLEYGRCADDLLFDWMRWRKLIYDIDNRSAQETGYLFEPILASCLGGESVSHKYSPVKRIDENGCATKEGRQVDCYIEDEKEVYELKLRVTIAASGQGRFSEEMSFPYEARMAGLKPTLIVFDPTPSALLEKLKNKYVEEGGNFAIGDDAWSFLEKRAGTEMGKYIIKYIKPPIIKMEKAEKVTPNPIKLSIEDDTLIITDINNNQYKIPRAIVSE